MKKAAIVAMIVAIAVAVLLVLYRSGSDSSFAPDPSPGTSQGDSTGVENKTADQDSEQPKIRPVENPDIEIVGRKPYDTGITDDRRVRTNEEGQHVATEAVEMAGRLHSPDSPAEEDLEYLEQILGIYRLSFQRNPVAGDNQMVMQALMGDNPRKLVVFPSNHPAINSDGELLDRWGTPYFFHALSGTEMEIFSAGPDKEFSTSDDVQRSYREDRPLTGAGLNADEDVGE